MYSFVLISTFLAAACAAPAGPPSYHVPQPSYHPQPKHHEPKFEEPKPYHYAYGVSDEYTGTNFEAAEDQDAYGVVNGGYSVLLPDGRHQNVKCTADHYAGYIADVSYEGYAAPAPVHKPAPYHPAPGHKPVFHAPVIHKPVPVYHPAPVHKPAPVYHPAPYHG